MEQNRYVAYVGTYTRGNSVGIYIYDIDPETWKMTERKVVPINNPSDLVVANNGKFLYSISDQGVRSFRIMEDGDLEPLNEAWTGGMRGCYLETDPEDRFLFVAGYYDGRVSVMRLNEDGSIGEICDGIFHQGIGLSITDRRSMPHVTCVKMAPNRKALAAVDSGLDQIKVYAIDFETGKLTIDGIIRCALDSAPRMIRINKKRDAIYTMGEMSNRVCVYRPILSADGKHGVETVQKISTIKKGEEQQAAATAIEFSPDGKHLFVSNAGVNSVVVYDVDQETGELTENCNVKCSGDYPKALAVLPDNEHFVVLSHNTGEMFTYKMNYDEHYYLLDAKPIKLEQPNCIYIHRLR